MALVLVEDEPQVQSRVVGCPGEIVLINRLRVPSGLGRWACVRRVYCGDVVCTSATTSYSFEIPDQHSTSGLSLDDTAQVPAWRQFTPTAPPAAPPPPAQATAAS